MMLSRRNPRLNRLILTSAFTVIGLSGRPTTLTAQIPDTGGMLDAPFARPGIPQRLLGPLFPVLRRLQLTADQRQQIQHILQGHRDEVRALVRRALEARRPLFAAVYIEPFDERTIRDRSAAVATVQADGAVLRATIRTEIFGVLTPDQQTRAIELLKRFVQRRAEADVPSPF
jgi:Spy/CpxP family protein refolding chaperone